jgi:hypothetical protein
MYKPYRTHVIANALSRLPDLTKPIGVPNQTIDVNMFYTKLEWLNDVNFFLRTNKIENKLFIQYK